MSETPPSKTSQRQKFKSVFQTGGSNEAIELLEKFILPFTKALPIVSSLDEAVLGFFAVHRREFFFARAVRDFNLPGKGYIAGNRPVYGVYPRRIKKGQKLLIAVDKKEGTARVEVRTASKDGEGEMRNFLLEKFEFETIKDWIEVLKK